MDGVRRTVLGAATRVSTHERAHALPVHVHRDGGQPARPWHAPRMRSETLTPRARITPLAKKVAPYESMHLAKSLRARMYVASTTENVMSCRLQSSDFCVSCGQEIVRGAMLNASAPCVSMRYARAAPFEVTWPK